MFSTLVGLGRFSNCQRPDYIKRIGTVARILFPGGFDIKSCETVSKQMNIPLNEVLYADLGKVFVMQTGKEPGIYDRYLTLESEEYKEYCRIIHREENQPKGKDR